jgi:hypothetical protein
MNQHVLYFDPTDEKTNKSRAMEFNHMRIQGGPGGPAPPPPFVQGQLFIINRPHCIISSVVSIFSWSRYARPHTMFNNTYIDHIVLYVKYVLGSLSWPSYNLKQQIHWPKLHHFMELRLEH